MLLAVLCQACLLVRPIDTLTPYFAGQVSAEKLTTDRPCPTGTELTERTALTATCINPQRPTDELVITFDEHDGHMVGYATSIEGYAHGTHRSWYPTGVAHESARWTAGKRDGQHVVHAADGRPVLEESYVDGLRTGSYAAYRGIELRDHGWYRRGLKYGHWEEYVDGRLVSGYYIDGKRTGEWQVRERGATSLPDYFVGFTDDRPTSADQAGDSYRPLIGVVDAAWIGLAVYGHYRDRRLEAAGAIGLIAAAPLIHAIEQHPSTRRKVVLDSLLMRPAFVAGTFALYSIGKFFAGMHCKSGYDSEDNYSRCHSVGLDYNTHYNWTALAGVAAASIAADDVGKAIKRKAVATERAWPQLSVMPVAKGSGIALSGAF